MRLQEILAQLKTIDKLDLSEAESLCEEAQSLSEEATLEEKCAILLSSSFIQSQLGRFELALQNGERALALATTTKDNELIARGQIRIGGLLWASGDYTGSVPRFIAAHELVAGLPESSFHQTIHYNLAAVYTLSNEIEKGIQSGLEAYRIAKDLGDYHNLAKICGVIGALLDKANRRDEGRKYYREAIDLRRQYPFPAIWRESY
ncbi:MAG TPA: hypothetical protein VG537_09100 [Candidatus Kapabacteria bacterium]|jgi:tetratricopeptide (TPR) repeat protein|nr:hypothetical protein [Candidatus Kapabacteria bacterium]